MKYRKSVKPVLVLAFLFFDIAIFSQQKDSLLTRSHEKPFRIEGFKISPLNDSLLKISQSLISPGSQESSQIYGALKEKASRSVITRKLYDFLVVGPTPQVNQVNITNENRYLPYSGKKIRKIEIRRLDVFGSDIKNPALENRTKLNNILNSTHFNTNESIIRKNLLFSEGDTLSPLTISDNERILRQLPFINDSRIIAIPASDGEVDLIVLTKDVYSLGASLDVSSLTKGSVSVFDKNIFGMGHEFRVEVPYNSDLPDSPGFGIRYNINNIKKSFINLQLFYMNGLGDKTYGFGLEKKLLSSETRYAGGISFRHMDTSEDLNNKITPEPLKYNLQDYWLMRSFLIDKATVSRIIIGGRYTNNNVFDRPVITSDSYYPLQKYRLFIGSASLSVQKYYKTNLIYNFGTTEDIPYGGLLTVTAGNEVNEYKSRLYGGISLSVGESITNLGYFYAGLAAGTFFRQNITEQGIFSARISYFSNLLYLGSSRLRNFIKVGYTRGFDRYTDESLHFIRENGFSGFRNDSTYGTQRLTAGVESVLFSHYRVYGFRFAFFGFAEVGYLAGTNQIVTRGNILSSIGLGVRIRNDNLVFNTLQVRLGYFPNLPPSSRASYFLVSGEQSLRPANFDPGPPSPIPYH